MKTNLFSLAIIATILFSFNSLCSKAESSVVNFWHNGENIHSVSVENGNNITSFPNTNSLSSTNDNLPLFVGWTTDTVGFTNTASNIEPNYFDFSTPISSNINLYAIFANGTQNDSWRIVSQTSELTDGCQVIIASTKKSVAAGPNTDNKYRKSNPITLSSDTTQITNIGDATIFTLYLNDSSQYYSFYSENENHYMVLLSSDKNEINITNTKIYQWNISISNKIATIQNTSFPSRYLEYNSSSPRFACYKQTQQPVSLYKKYPKATLWTISAPTPLTPSIQTDSTSINFGIVTTNSSQIRSFNLSGNNLTDNITITSDNNKIKINPTSISPINNSINQLITISLETSSIDNINSTLQIKHGDNILAELPIFASIIDEQFYTINFYHYNNIIHSTKVKKGEPLGSFPSIEPLYSNNDELQYHIGWTNNKNGYEDIIATVEPMFFSPTSPITQNTNLYAVFSNGHVWSIVTNTTELNSGDSIVIAAHKSNVALSTTQNSNNRGQAEILKKGNTISFDNDVQKLTLQLGKVENTFAFYTGNGYLYAASSSSNDLKTKLPLDANASWSISINDSIATIIAQGTATRNLLKYNKIHSLFSCYASDNTSMQKIVLYKYRKPTKWTICSNPQHQITLNYNDGSVVKFSSLTLNIPQKYTPPFNDKNIKFVGWSNSIVHPTNSRPTLYNDTTNLILTEDVNLYPVFATQHSKIKPFDLHATHAQKVVIAAYINGTWKALKNTINKTGTQDYFDITTTSSHYNYVQEENNSDFIWTITKEANGYTISNGNEYLYGAENSTNIGIKSDKIYWTITSEPNNTYLISNTTNRCLLFRASETTNKIGHYATSNKNGQEYNRPTLLTVGSSQTTYSSIPQKYIDTEDFYLSENLDVDIIVEPNLTLHITNDCSINSLTIKTNSDDCGYVNTTNGSLSTKQITIEKCFNSSRWFFFSLPFDCDLTNISATDANGNVLSYAPNTTSGDYVINYYDQNRSTETGKAWKELIGTNHTLKANQGYIIGYFGDGQIIVKFPSKTPQTITTPSSLTLDYTDSWINTENPSTSTNGWNLIGYPYFAPTNSSLSPQFATIPNPDGITYTQTEYSSTQITPFTSFFVQTTTAPIFEVNNNLYAPASFEPTTNKITVLLSDSNSLSDQTTIINNPNSTTDYEIGLDLAKWLGFANIPQIYSIQNDELLAFNTQHINTSTTIPLGIYIPKSQEYTFSLNNYSLSAFNIYLHDNYTQSTIDLGNNDYSLHLDSGTYNNRFELRFNQHITTNSHIEKENISISQNNETLHIENLTNQSIVYIYDAVGRLIFQSPNNITSLNYNFSCKGIYIVTIQTNDSTSSFKISY